MINPGEMERTVSTPESSQGWFSLYHNARLMLYILACLYRPRFTAEGSSDSGAQISKLWSHFLSPVPWESCPSLEFHLADNRALYERYLIGSSQQTHEVGNEVLSLLYKWRHLGWELRPDGSTGLWILIQRPWHFFHVSCFLVICYARSNGLISRKRYE